jgi:hypothetical protein
MGQTLLFNVGKLLLRLGKMSGLYRLICHHSLVFLNSWFPQFSRRNW